MKRIFLSILLTSCAIIAICGASPAQGGDVVNVIPKPVFVESHNGFFTLSHETKIVYFFKNKEMQSTIEQFEDRLRTATGYKFALRDGFDMPTKDFIFFNYVRDETLGDEGYRLEVDGERITVDANTDAGFFCATQTLLQLLPPEVFSPKTISGIEWKIPCVSITDKPRFKWRGMHLDVSRHFFPKEFIETYLDMLAMHKINMFHWHLTDDQGWRIEIKKYPKLTEIGAWRVNREDQPWNDRKPQQKGEAANYGGYYKQDEIKEIVRYAAARHITIVPEIEMPAHCVAALAAYPQFSCSGGPFTVPPGGVWPDSSIYCAGNDSTFIFLEDVLSEVTELFPGPYIHIGGDEADKSEWKKCPKCQARIKENNLKDESELQSYFIKRIEKFLISKHRRLIGWDEILEGGLAPEATVMSWRGVDGGIAAARADHDVVMTPGDYCYFDHYQGTEEYEPPAIGGYTPLSKVYAYEPIPDSLMPEQATHILGAQANVWSEYIPVPEHAEYMTLPRMAAIAEVLWSPKDLRNWSDFVPRIEQEMKRYEILGYNYAKSAYLVGISTALDTVSKRITVSLTSELGSSLIRYSLDGTVPTYSSPRYEHPFTIEKTSVVRAGTFRDTILLDKITEQKIYLHKAVGKRVALKYPYEEYTGGGDYALTNGVRGSNSSNDGNWQGFHQNDLEAVIDLGESMPITRINSSYLEDTPSWIFLPTEVEYSVSDDGINYTSTGIINVPVPGENQEVGVKEFLKELTNVKARYVKVHAKNVGIVPAWHIGRGDKAWLFVDEIIVE